ncbi:mRNA export factor-like protein [Euroglyphus maynei]|uniref:mRNA export factor-like protein n=1 Tax=Euroglyphus maynei TaxID=6958 RepID=A0A1Y3BEB7_EURMA|nr:mRNA export factor-like protein [Euroglyphus maynei]
MSFFGNPTPGTSTSLFAPQNTIGSSTMFNVPGTNPTSTPFGSSVVQTGAHNPNKDIEVSSSPDDSIAGLAFSPPTLSQNFLVSGSWDNQIRCWEVVGATNAWQTIPKAQQAHAGPVLDVRFSDDGTKVFSASADKTVKMWDLASNQQMQVAQHDQPVKTCHFIKAPNYTCLMTTSFDKTIKLWDLRQAQPAMTVQLSDKVFCADVHYPMAVVSLANRAILVYSLENGLQQFKQIESPLKYQHRCVSIFTDKDKSNNPPTGFAVGSVEGRVAIQYLNPANPKDNFTFKCHRSNGTSTNFQDVFIVHDIAFHPQHGTLATVGSDGRYSFWDKDARTKLKTSEQVEQPITRCAFSARGEIFAYSVSYDWSKGHEYFNPQKKNYIFLHGCFEELRPRKKN